MIPYVQDADFTLLCCDVLDGLRSLADGSVHCVVTSPPYWGLRDYGTGEWERRVEWSDEGKREALADAAEWLGRTMTAADAEEVKAIYADPNCSWRGLASEFGSRHKFDWDGNQLAGMSLWSGAQALLNETWDDDPDHKHDTVPARGGRGGSGSPGKQTDGAFPSTLAVDTCSCGARRVDQQLGLEPTPDLYVQRMVEVFREVRRVLRADGTCWLNLGDSYASSPPGNKGTPDEAYKSSGLAGARAGSRYMETLASSVGQKRNSVVGGLKPKDLVGIPWLVARALQEPYYTGRIKDERDRIWLAAMVEAEGCMFIHRRKAGTDSGSKFTKKDGTEVSYQRTQDTFGSGLEVSSTDRVIVERCMSIAGVGSICEQGPNENARRKQTIYRWNVRSNECRWIIEELYPHFYAKQHEARLVIGCPSSGEDARKAWESVKAIHQGQAATIDFDPPEPKWERGWFLRSDVIWSKPQPDARVGDRPADEGTRVRVPAQ